MYHNFINAAVVSIIYLLIKVVERKFIEKEDLNIKLLLRDTLILFFSVIAGYYLIEQINPMIYGSEKQSLTNPQVFTDNPAF